MSVRSFAHSMSKDTLATSGLPFTTSSSFGQMVVNSWCIACLASNKGQDCYQPREAILKGKAGSVQKRSAGGEEHTRSNALRQHMYAMADVIHRAWCCSPASKLSPNQENLPVRGVRPHPNGTGPVRSRGSTEARRGLESRYSVPRFDLPSLHNFSKLGFRA